MKHLQIQLRKMARGDPNYPPPCQPLWLKEIHVTLLPAIFESMGAKLAQLSKLAPKKMKMRNCSINFHHCRHREGHSESASKVRDLNTRSSLRYTNIGFFFETLSPPLH
jgi:hypothetical protein